MLNRPWSGSIEQQDWRIHVKRYHIPPLPIDPTLLEKAHHLRGRQISRNVNHEYAEVASLGDRLADRLSEIAGSWSFILFFLAFILSWALINTSVLITHAFDPYPYIFLNLMLSMLAALQAPVIMMSQNRQAQKDRIQADLDYHVNLKAEAEIAALHHKLDDLREMQWAELVDIQQEQIRLLEQMVAGLQHGKDE